jgi:hypothetical protein
LVSPLLEVDKKFSLPISMERNKINADFMEIKKGSLKNCPYSEFYYGNKKKKSKKD